MKQESGALFAPRCEPPKTIRNLPAWLCWRYEPNSTGKPRKVPYYVSGSRRHGDQGSPHDVANLASYGTALAVAQGKGFDGVGFATLAVFNVCALDFDNCVVDGAILPGVEALVGDTYAELSPSGNGVRIFCEGNLGDAKDSHGTDFGMEVFSTKGYVTFTGNVIDTVEVLGNEDQVSPVNPQILKLHSERFIVRYSEQNTDKLSIIGLTSDELSTCLQHLDPNMPHAPWLQVGMGLHHETGGAGFERWDEWSRQSDKYPGTEVLRSRWDSFGRNRGNTTTARTLVKLANAAGAGVRVVDRPEVDTNEFPDLSGVSPPAKVLQPCRFQVLTASEFATTEPTTWLIKHVLPRAELVVMYGASGSGKSFMALNMAAAVATGQKWRGKKTTQGKIVYVAAEGAGGFKKRMAAYAQHNKMSLDDLNIGVIAAAPNMLDLAHAKDVVRAISDSGGAQLVIIDTLAQSMPGGNENAGEDMGQAMAHCKLIHQHTGATVLLVHHSGKDTTKGARGWSGLRAAADAELEVIRAPTGRCMRISKQKDGDDSAEWGFGLEIVTIGMDEDLEDITSCVVVEADVPRGSAAAARELGPNEALLHQIIQEMAKVQTAGIEEHEVIAEAIRRTPPRTDGKRDQRKTMFKNALKTLCDFDGSGYIREDGCIEVLV